MVKIEIDPSAIYRLPEVTRSCGITARTVKKAVNSGDLTAAERGGVIFIEGEALRRWLTGQPKQATTPEVGAVDHA